MKHLLSKNIAPTHFLFVLVLLFFFVPATSFAAILSVTSKSSSVAPGNEFLVQITLNTEGELINAVAGKVAFPSDRFDLKEVRDGNSQVNVWLEKPHQTKAGEISFSGITPGGLSGADKLLFSLVFTAKKAGSAQISVSFVQALKNDGQGTAVETKTTPVTIAVLPGSNDQSSNELAANDAHDTQPPESFVPAVGADPNIFSGQHFLVFTTQDKESGIDHYEVREGLFDTYIVAISPYLLKDQTLKSKIYVKAIDKQGNERIETLAAINGMSLYVVCIFLGIILLVCFFVFMIFKKIRSRG